MSGLDALRRPMRDAHTRLQAICRDLTAYRDLQPDGSLEHREADALLQRVSRYLADDLEAQLAELDDLQEAGDV